MLLSFQVNEAGLLLYQRLARDAKLRELLVSYFCADNDTKVTLKIYSEALLLINNKHNYKTFTKIPLCLCYNVSETFLIFYLGSAMIL